MVLGGGLSAPSWVQNFPVYTFCYLQSPLLTNITERGQWNGVYSTTLLSGRYQMILNVPFLVYVNKKYSQLQCPNSNGPRANENLIGTQE